MKLVSRFLLLALACGAVLASSVRGAAGASRPNVIFILTDDQGWGDTGYNGHPYLKTPHLDRLAAEGMAVSQFYVNSTVCSPSRVAFMTGRYPAREGFNHITSSPDVNKRRQVPDWLNPDVPTVADAFKRAGYATGHFGKWHLGKYLKSPAPTEYGFDVASVSSGPGETLARYHDNNPDAKARAAEDPQTRMTRHAFDAGIDFIRAHRNGPFYLNLWSPLPHAPLRLTAEQQASYAGITVNPDDPAFGPWMKKYLAAAKNAKAQMMMHLAAVTEVDHNVGRLMAALKELGLDQNTIVIFSSDNGPEDYYIGNAANAGVGSAGPFRGRKRSVYEGGTRVPFIARWPGHIPAGHVDRTSLVSGVDFLPTVAALAGIAYEGRDIDGENLSAVLLGRPAERRRPLFWEWFFEVVGDRDYFAPPLAAREGSWKFYCDYAGGAVELYDVTQDPSELKNVAAAHADVVKRLQAQTLAWVQTLPASGHRDAVVNGADRMTLLDIRKPGDRKK